VFIPSTILALKLGRALGCPVEALFQLAAAT
jgi:DNA-binding XRE family transcriptional regulator